MVVVDISIGPGVPHEARELTRLHHRAALTAFAHLFPADAPTPDFEHDLARWTRWLANHRHSGRLQSHVARNKAGRVVGVVLAGPDPEAPDIGHLSRFYVDPDHWATGIGTRLYDAAAGDLGTRFDAATLWVLEGNDRARAWYERLGWRVTPNRKPTYALELPRCRGHGVVMDQAARAAA